MDRTRRVVAPGRWALAVLLLLAACAVIDEGGLAPGDPEPGAGAERGRLWARPDPEAGGGERTGRFEVPNQEGTTLVLVPDGHARGGPPPLAVTLHGARGGAGGGMGLWRDHAAREGIILVAPEAEDGWGFGTPVARLDRALDWVFQRYAVDPERVAAVGFSAGASFALVLGPANGDLFTHVVAYAPGPPPEVPTEGMPRVFVAHGTEDRTIPIDRGGRAVEERLRAQGYDLEYVEYEGGHRPPDRVFRRSVAWFLE